jgi:hypothetical protein
LPEWWLLSFRRTAMGLLPLVTGCKNSLFAENFLPKNASRIKGEEKGKTEMYRLSSSNSIRKGLA